MFGDLQQALDSQLAAKSAVLTVRLDQWPLDVSDRNLLHTRVSGAAAASVAAGASQTVAMPELGDGGTGLVELREETAGTGRVFVQHAGITPSGRYLATPWTYPTGAYGGCYRGAPVRPSSSAAAWALAREAP